jgi:hypothetical protein
MNENKDINVNNNKNSNNIQNNDKYNNTNNNMKKNNGLRARCCWKTKLLDQWLASNLEIHAEVYLRH